MQVNINNDIWKDALSYCSGEDLLMMGCVNTQLHELTGKIFPILLEHDKNYFGITKWLKHGEEINNVPEIPPKMRTEFIKANGTAMLTLILKQIDSQPVDLKSFEKWVCKKNKPKTYGIYKLNPSYLGITDELIKKYQVQSDHWFLLFKGVPEETRNKPYLKQKEIIEENSYEVPSLMGTVVSALVHKLETGEFVFTDDSYTRVEEISKHGTNIIIGGTDVLDVDGLKEYVTNDIGVAFARKSIR